MLGDIYFLPGLPYIYIKPLETLVAADLHLGYEIVLAEEEGYFIPQTQFKEIMNELAWILSKFNIKRIIINGDLKHKFSKRTKQETREVISFLNFVSDKINECIVIRGNHDNFVRGIFRKYSNVQFIEQYFELDKYIFTHGHILNDEIASKMTGKTVVIGHEHPALLIRDDVGGKIKIPAFVYGNTCLDGKIIVLPAVSPLMSGTELNVISQNEFLSPILKKFTDIRQLTPLGIIRGKETLEFPEIGRWAVNRNL